MRPLFIALLAVCLPQLAEAQSLREARASLQKGNYAEAQELYADLLKAPENRVPASLGLSRAFEAEGELDAALKTLDAALKDHATDANLLARKAELLHAQGKWDAALKSADAARKQKDDHLLAHWVQAQIIRDGGDWPKAVEEFRWFVRRVKKYALPADMLVAQLVAPKWSEWQGKNLVWPTRMSPFYEVVKLTFRLHRQRGIFQQIVLF